MTVHQQDVNVPRIQPLGGEQWVLSGLSDVTVVIGKNGSGKSVLLRAWRDKDPDQAHYVAPERTGEMQFAAQLLQDELGGQQRRGYSGTVIAFFLSLRPHEICVPLSGVDNLSIDR